MEHISLFVFTGHHGHLSGFTSNEISSVASFHLGMTEHDGGSIIDANYGQ